MSPATPLNATFDYPEKVVELVEAWRQLLIPHWTVRMMSEPKHKNQAGPKGNYGQCEVHVDKHLLKVWLNLEHEDIALDMESVGESEVLEETIVHELLHPIVDEIEAVYKPLLKLAKKDHRKHIQKMAEEAREIAIERVTEVLYAKSTGKTRKLLVPES